MVLRERKAEKENLEEEAFRRGNLWKSEKVGKEVGDSRFLSAARSHAFITQLQTIQSITRLYIGHKMDLLIMAWSTASSLLTVGSSIPISQMLLVT